MANYETISDHDFSKSLESAFTQLFQNGVLAISYARYNGEIVEANGVFLSLFGYTETDLISGEMNWKKMTPAEFLPSKAAIESLQTIGHSPVLFKEYLHKEGRRIAVLISSTVIDHPQADVINCLFEVVDRSMLKEQLKLAEAKHNMLNLIEHKKIRETLYKTNERIRKITEHMVDVIIIYDREYRYLYVSPAIINYFGNPAAHYIGKICGQAGIPEDISMLFRKSIDQVFREKENVMLEFTINGDTFLQSLLTPELNEEGAVEMVMAVTRDITLLKQKEQQKDGFISMVGHEMKTPIASLKAMIQLAQRALHNGNLTESVKFMDKAEKHVNKQVSMIEHLMEVSRVDTGKIKMVYTTFPLINLIADCVELVAVNHDPAMIDVDCDVDLILSADWNRVEQVILNLLSNASRYSSPDKRIEISAIAEDGYCIISIKDYGIGIDPQKLAYIFERFYRVNEDGQHSSGLGLGLFISAQIIKMHKGKIWVESELGKGSVFYLKLPLNK